MTTIRRITKYALRAAMLLVVSASLSSCALFDWRKSFELKDVRVVGFSLSDGVTVDVTLHNKLPFKVTITGGELEGYLDSTAIGALYIRDAEVVIPRRSTSTVRLNLGLRFSSFQAALGAVSALKESPESITVSGYGQGKVLFFTKRVERKDVPMSKFMAIFGRPSDYLD